MFNVKKFSYTQIYIYVYKYMYYNTQHTTPLLSTFYGFFSIYLCDCACFYRKFRINVHSIYLFIFFKLTNFISFSMDFNLNGIHSNLFFSQFLDSTANQMGHMKPKTTGHFITLYLCI